eukprot:6214827-Pleurochrysis_carterae.AAC.2
MPSSGTICRIKVLSWNEAIKWNAQNANASGFAVQLHTFAPASVFGAFVRVRAWAASGLASNDADKTIAAIRFAAWTLGADAAAAGMERTRRGVSMLGARGRSTANRVPRPGVLQALGDLRCSVASIGAIAHQSR